jgi:hypothetical protein
MLIVEKEDGVLDWVHRTPKNEMLYNPEKYGVDVLVIEDGQQQSQWVRDTPLNRERFAEYDYQTERRSLYEFLHGAARDELLELNESEPFVGIAPTVEPNVFRLRVGEKESYTVYTPASQSRDVLNGVVELFDTGKVDPLVKVYQHVLDTQVRRDAIEKFIQWGVFDSECVEITPEGWILTPRDEYGEPDIVRFIVTYDAKNYLYTENWDAASYTPRARKNDTAGQFRALKFEDAEGRTETVYEPETRNGIVEMVKKEYYFGENEMHFLHTVSYLLNWVENFDDPTAVAVIRRTYRDHGGTLR